MTPAIFHANVQYSTAYNVSARRPWPRLRRSSCRDPHSHRNQRRYCRVGQFLMTQMCRTFMMTLSIVNQFEKHILLIWNIISLFKWPFTRLPFCQSSKWPPLARIQAWRRALHQLRYQLHSLEGRAKCPFLNVLKSELVMVDGTRTAGQGSK